MQIAIHRRHTEKRTHRQVQKYDNSQVDFRSGSMVKWKNRLPFMPKYQKSDQALQPYRVQ